MSTRKSIKVFVYGTLRGGLPEDAVATHKLHGAQLWEIHSGNFAFPSVRITGNTEDVVVGNVLTVSKKELKELDRYENVASGLYSRQRVTVYGVDSYDEQVEAWVYVGSDTLFPSQIQSGDWFDR